MFWTFICGLWQREGNVYHFEIGLEQSHNKGLLPKGKDLVPPGSSFTQGARLT